MTRLHLHLTILFGCLLTLPAGAQPPDLARLPRGEDYTHMWWAEGFPGHTPDAPWLRVIQTGRYAMSLNTRTLQVPNLGPVPAGVGYEACARQDNRTWQTLPPANLDLTITANGKDYRCTQGGAWSRFRGPRLIESGRFVQRADITDLTFTAADGSVLNAEARFETVAWPDRLSLILEVRPRDTWENASIRIRLTSEGRTLEKTSLMPDHQSRYSRHTCHLAFNPETFQIQKEAPPISVEAFEKTWDRAKSVAYAPAEGWHRIDLDRVYPQYAPRGRGGQHDVMERIRLVLKNNSTSEQTARLLFSKSKRGIRSRSKAAITGVSAILRDANGQPTGIPVQLSKNWHDRREGGTYSGQWFHGFTQLRLPPGADIELELSLVYGHWGGVAAASHAQLSLIGWGSNQLWTQSAVGAWGESICFEPDQAQAEAGILDVRPLMVTPKNGNRSWYWTHNVGGGDAFRLYDTKGRRVFPGRMKTAFTRHGPCLSEVTYSGRTGPALEHSLTAFLGRTDDIVRGVYRLRLEVKKPVSFSRFVLFQIGADTYSYTGERKMALGNTGGLTQEWNTSWGGNTYRSKPRAWTGRTPWVSLHEAVPGSDSKTGAWANRGLVLRDWKARLGGREAAPWVAEYGVKASGRNTSTIDLVPPEGVTHLEPGDFIDATIEQIVMPQFSKEYYGPNEPLRQALTRDENTWRMIHREAIGNDRRVQMETGTLKSLHPAITIETRNDSASCRVSGGLGYVPVMFTGLTTPHGFTLRLNGKTVDQSVHGNDFWQTDFDPETGTWQQTYTLPLSGSDPQTLTFDRK